MLGPAAGLARYYWDRRCCAGRRAVPWWLGAVQLCRVQLLLCGLSLSCPVVPPAIMRSCSRVVCVDNVSSRYREGWRSADRRDPVTTQRHTDTAPTTESAQSPIRPGGSCTQFVCDSMLNSSSPPSDDVLQPILGNHKLHKQTSHPRPDHRSPIRGTANPAAELPR